MRKLFQLLFITILPTVGMAQKGGPVVFTVDNDTVWGAEFERVFSKNNRSPEVKPSLEELKEYRELYVRFKLKVKEAHRLGMDTNVDYQKELAGYRKQLAQPYLTDKEVTEKLVKEAYERSQKEVDASNLMIYLSPIASPADTLAAWNQINRWRNIIVSGKQSFEQLTRDSSSDEHGKKQAGRLGYFTAFNMIYPFENNAYNTPVGGISMPFRTQFGYHIIKVHDVREARNDLKVAHILIRVNNPNQLDTMKPRIDAIYQRLKNGEKWDQLVLDFSEDFNTRERGGELQWVKSIGGNIPNNFREAAYNLKDGKFSEPIKTELGWHIIKRIEQRPNPTFDESKESIKLKINRDSRSELNKTAVLARVKEENNFQVNRKNLDDYLKQVDSTAIKGINWKTPESLKSKTPLFSVGDSTFTYAHFTNFIIQNPANGEIDPKRHVDRLFTQFTDNANLAYEELILEDKYDDFKYLMQEYRDGILLFELTNEKVWSRATDDTTGLKNFFEKNQENYQWNQRAKVREYTCTNSKTASKLQKGISKGWSDEKLKSKLNKKDILALKVSQKVIERGKDSTYDALNWTGGLQRMEDASSNYIYVRFDSLIAPGPKTLKESMGPATSDYQKYLEDEWIATLKERYEVNIKEGALKKLFASKQ